MQAFDVTRVRADFPILTREVRKKSLVYLDNAASTLKPLQVIERMSKYYMSETSNVHRGAHFLAEQGTIAYEGARETIRSFINARSAAEVIFTRGTTESVNLVAQAWGRTFLKAGDEIILSVLEHHSNIVPWQMIAEEKGCTIKVIPINDEGEMNYEEYLKLLSPRTKMVAITWCSNALGTITPVEKFIRAARDVGAKTFIDAAQAVQHLKTDVQAMGCDFLGFSGHKIYGPYGIGVLYGKQELLEEMAPYQTGGSMIGEVTFEKTTFAQPPQKFEAGTPSISAAVALGTAIDYVNSLGLEAIEQHEHILLKAATERLKSIPGVRIIGDVENKSAIVSFVMDGIHPSDIGNLVDHQGIAIRTGHHCTQPLMKRLGVPATARASFSIYNTLQEVDVLHAAILKVKEFF